MKPLANFFFSVVLFIFAASASVASAQVAVIGNTIEEYTASPGERYSSSVLLENSTDATQSVRVYQTDYTFQADGTSQFDDPGTIARSNAKWITPVTRVLVVPARSKMSVAYTVRVPRDTTLSGSYWSTIMVEASPAPPAGGRGGSSAQLSLGAVTRYAVQIATHIGSTGTRKIAFRSPAVVVDQAGEQAFEVEVSNAGDRAYRAKLWIELFDSTGKLRKRLEQQRGLLYPGASLKQHFELGKLERGSYKAMVFADTGDPAVFARQFSIEL